MYTDDLKYMYNIKKGGNISLKLHTWNKVKLKKKKKKYYHYLIILQIQIIGCTSFVPEGKKKHVTSWETFCQYTLLVSFIYIFWQHSS